ncbi:MAG TPA: CoA transferase, partial [Mycobacteriales bacterium]|nr:CoA transferase [Mycobacteriales bacterium]
MAGVMQGVKVLEVAGWTFVPAAGAVLADWGADVIKVEHPETGDPQRGLSVGAVGAKGIGGVSFIMEQPNRGKRSLGIDIASERGKEILRKLIEQSDVFVTSLLADSLERLGLGLDDVRKINPAIIYARGTGQGVRGEEATRGGYDLASYWTRGGIAHMLKDPTQAWPPLQRPAFGDIVGGFAIAAGIAAALFKRATTGEPSVVDVSLLGLAAWQLSPDIVAAGLLGEENLPRFSHEEMPNPIVNTYPTSDGRFVALVMLQADRFWPEVCELIERPDFVEDPRFATAGARFENRVECVNELKKAFLTRPLAEWRERMKGLEGVWSVVQTPGEVLTDPQVVSNGYVRPVKSLDGNTEYSLVANPVQFDETPPDLVRAPDHGQHTDEILAELGFDWDTIVDLKVASVVL